MKQITKRILCFLFAAIMTISAVPAGNSIASKESDVLFEDDFSSSSLSGWKSKSVGNISDGVYVLGQDGYNIITALENQGDCIVTADVAVNIGKDASGARQGGTAGIVIRADADGSCGYEFSLGITKAGVGYLRLYRRGSGDNGIILLQKTKDIPAVEKITRNQTYTLCIAAIGSRILCFINGSLFADVTDATYTSGFVGVKTTGAKGTFDNVKIQSTVERQIESITVVSHSETVSLAGKVYVTIDVNYNSVYGTEQLNQDSEGVSISGLDGTAGNKTITVSYGDKQATFPLKVTEKFSPKVLHQETFDTAMSGYEDGIFTNKEYNITYQFSAQNGRGVVSAVDTKGADVPISVDLTVPEKKSAEWKQYSVSADVAVTGDAKTATARVGQAALIVAKKTADRSNYTFRVTSAGTIAVYCGSTLLYTNTASALGVSFSVGTEVNLRADVYEDHAEFYYNNMLVTVLADINVDSITPRAGLSAVNGSAWFDNWTVKELEAKGEHAVKSFEIVSAATRDKVTSIRSREFLASDLLLKVAYIDNTIGLVVVKENMLSSYARESTTAQTITITYAGKKKEFTYTYVPYLFYDDFSSGYRSQWDFHVDSLSSYEAKNGKLNIKYADGGNKASSVTGFITGGEEWTNYAISADVFMDARAKISGRSRTVGLTARKTGNYYYEFRLEYQGTRLTGALFRFDQDGATKLQTFGTSQLRECVGETKSLGLGVEYNIRLEVRGSMVKCYLDNVALPVYVDSSERALTGGTAGIKSANNTATYDNVIVQLKSAQAIKALRLSGTTDNTVSLYEGFDIDLPSYSLEVVDVDGSYDSVSLTKDVISEYDNTALGRQQITLTYQGFSYPAVVVISERPEELEAFADAVRAIDVKDVLEKSEAISELKEQYDSFSPYEISKIDEKAITKYEEILEAMERAKDANLKGLELLWADSLNEVTTDTWGDSIEGNSGKWFHLNGTFYQAQRPYNLVVNGWRSPDVYGELYSISADMQMLSQDMYMGIALNMSEKGYYHVRVSNKDRNENKEVVYKIQLLKKTNNGHTVLISEYLTTYDIKLNLGVKFNLKLTLKDGVLTACINGTQVLIYDDSTNNNQYTYGECGLRISEGDGKYDNIRVYGTALERPKEDTETIEPTYYEDDFEDETVGSSPSHWQENYTASTLTDNWKIFEKNASKVYGTDVTSGLTETWLHVFEKNPAFSTKFMVEKAGRNGQIGFITRRSPDTAFVNVGYDFASAKWYVASQESEAGGCETFWADEPFNLKKGEWYTARVEVSEKTVVLYIDDREVLSLAKVLRTGFGRLGFFTNQASMYVDDVDCTFKYGDIPQDGLISYVVEPDKYSNYMEIESTDGGQTLIGVGKTKKLSRDAGKTWTDITSDAAWSGLKIGNYPTLLQLQSNGKYIQILQSDAFEVLTSSDMKNWTTIGHVLSEDELESEEGYLWAVIHVNSATEFDIGNGQYRIFLPIGFQKHNQQGAIIGHFTKIYYSDDAGVTWQCAETTTKDLLPGYEEDDSSTWCESKIVQCDDGTLRMYYSRNYLGCMQYTVSTDNGVTWKGMYQIPEMQNAMTSFAVIEDPAERGTYYMLWINGKARYLGSVLPRVRPCLLRSTDGKNWEFLMNCEYMTEFNSTTNGESLYQILDPSLYVTEDYVYITFGRSEREFARDNANSHQAQRCYYLRVEKDKLQARAWDASTVASMSYPKKIEFETMPRTKFGKGDLFNTYGGTIKITALNGTETTEEISKNCSVYVEPNMAKLGTVTIPVYYVNGYELTYDINIVPNYNVKWEISEGGTVDPKERRIMEGEDLEVTLLPDSGYTVDYLLVNGENVSVRNKMLKIENVSEDLEIQVVFRELTWLDYLPWIIGGVIVIAVTGGALYLFFKKKKQTVPVE